MYFQSRCFYGCLIFLLVSSDDMCMFALLHSEDEDRQMEAAIRASMAVRRQEERGAAQERSAPKHCREERTERAEAEEPRHRSGHSKPTNKPPGEKKTSYRSLHVWSVCSCSKVFLSDTFCSST